MDAARRGGPIWPEGERGQAAVLLVAIVAIGVVLLLALVPVAQVATTKAQAKAAADAAALAGAAEGEEAAREVAEANGAELEHWRAVGDDVWVEVSIGRARAVAKAHRD